MVPQLLVLALVFHRKPLRFVQLTDPTQPLPEAFGTWLAEAAKALAPGKIKATAEALETEPQELQEAFLFFLRQTLLSPRADHYRILGLSRRSSGASVKRSHGLMVRMFHPDRLSGETERNSMLTARINAAYQTLYDPQVRRRYDKTLPPLTDNAQSRAWAPELFRPRNPIKKHRASGRHPPRPPRHLRQAVTWMLAASVFAAVLFLALEDEQPMLQINPKLATGTDSGPAVQTIGQSDSAPIENRGQVDVKPTAPAATRLQPVTHSAKKKAAQIQDVGAVALETTRVQRATTQLDTTLGETMTSFPSSAPWTPGNRGKEVEESSP